MSLLTVAVPTLNRAPLVRRAVASALAQTRGDVEVFVSNNGSADDTRQVLGEFDDPRVRVVHHERTMPPMVHGAYVTREVRTPFAVFLSDDDFLEPAFAERTLAVYQREAGLAFVHTAVNFVHPGGSFVSAAHPPLMDGWELLLRFPRRRPRAVALRHGVPRRRRPRVHGRRAR
jgi:glycosyltransferase involved in cell wall biosynthesis